MRNLKIIFTLLFIALTAICCVNGQKTPVKFGKVPIEDIEMTYYPLDSTAEAVILCDYGNLRPEEFRFTRIKRIKILKKEGTRWASMILPITEQSHVRGRTYNLVDGEIVVDKLKSESIFKEKVTDYWYETRISLPNVKAGSVIEIIYSMQQIPKEWRFQDQIPVRHSELRLPEHQYYDLQKHFTGYEPLTESSSWRWVGKDMPAFDPEPYINSVSNYLKKIELEIASISIPGYLYKDYTTSWRAVNDYYYDHELFGAISRGVFLYLSDAAEEINRTCSENSEKIVKAVNVIRNEIQWNGRDRLFSVSNPGNIYNSKKTGSSADINFLLLQLLKKTGIDAYPMILSTRENGIVLEYFPTVDRFNYMIVYTESGDKQYFLDATDRFVPAGILPEKCLNGMGFVIMKENGKWVKLPNQVPSVKKTNCEMKLDKSGELTGSMSTQHANYAASRFRSHFDDFNSTEEFLDDFEQQNGGCEVLQYNVEDLDSLEKPVIEKYQISLNHVATSMGNMIYIEPVFFGGISENPFRIEDRVYPVDYTCPQKVLFYSRITMPEGYVPEEIPKPCRLTMPDNTANFSYSVAQLGDAIQVMCQLNINKAVFLQMEYKNLKEFYNQVVSKQAEPIILKANNDES
jgi:hypothetical protein